MASSESLQITTGGAFVAVGTTRRAMSGYFVQENELSQLGTLHGGAGLAFSFGTTVLLLALGLKLDAIIQGALTEQGKLLVGAGFPLLLVMGALTWIIAVVLYIQRGSVIKRIKKETEAIT